MGDNIKMDPKEICCEDMDCICLGRNAFLWPYVVNTLSYEQGLLSYSATYFRETPTFRINYSLFHPGLKVCETMKHQEQMASVKFDKVRNSLAP
jgi:hypothetical protein